MFRKYLKSEKNPNNKFLKGFTLIEVLLTIGISTIILAFAAPYSLRQISENKVISAASELNGNIFRYQQYSFSNKDQNRYGVKFDEGSYTLFTILYNPDPVQFDLADFDDRDVSLDEVFEYGESITSEISGTDIVYFQIASFRPIDIISVSLTDGVTEVVVEITTEGLIDYYVN